MKLFSWFRGTKVESTKTDAGANATELAETVRDESGRQVAYNEARQAKQDSKQEREKAKKIKEEEQHWKLSKKRQQTLVTLYKGKVDAQKESQQDAEAKLKDKTKYTHTGVCDHELMEKAMSKLNRTECGVLLTHLKSQYDSLRQLTSDINDKAALEISITGLNKRLDRLSSQLTNLNDDNFDSEAATWCERILQVTASQSTISSAEIQTLIDVCEQILVKFPEIDSLELAVPAYQTLQTTYRQAQRHIRRATTIQTGRLSPMWQPAPTAEALTSDDEAHITVPGVTA